MALSISDAAPHDALVQQMTNSTNTSTIISTYTNATIDLILCT
jgi:hypothetical protein